MRKHYYWDLKTTPHKKIKQEAKWILKELGVKSAGNFTGSNQYTKK